jgi:methylglutaconyl-CoA hydratase
MSAPEQAPETALGKAWQTLEVLAGTSDGTKAGSPTGVVHVRMNRPQVFNAFDEAMIAELDAAFSLLADDPAVRVVVLEGAGKAFSAGADLQWMQRASTASFEWNLADARRFASMLWKIHHCPKPTIARVQGVALGGGVGLAAACDFAIASSRAQFAVSEAKFGILPSVIGPYLTNAVGKRQAMRLALTTSRIGAAEAQSIGLVQQVVEAAGLPPDASPEAKAQAESAALDAAVAALVAELLVGGPNAQREIKALYAQMAVGPVGPETLELTAQTIARVRGTDEAKEGFAAFLAKRPAAWVPQEPGASA